MKKQVEKAPTAKQVEKIVGMEASKSAKIKELFEMGLEVKTIAEALGIRYNFAYNVISNYVNMNGIKVEKNVKASKKDAIIKLYLDGKTNKEISIELKTNYNYVFNTLKAYKASQEVSTESEAK